MKKKSTKPNALSNQMSGSRMHVKGSHRDI